MPEYKNEGWTINQGSLDWLIKTVKAKSENPKILEFGSGNSTIYFADSGIKVVSVEHNKQYLPVHPNVTSIYSPTENRWYTIPPEHILGLSKEYGPFDGIVIDGPTGAIGRWTILRYLHYLYPDGFLPTLVDDVNRDNENCMMIGISTAYRTEIEIISKNNSKCAHLWVENKV